MTEAKRIAAGLSEAQRDMAVALCGNAWQGGTPTPGILIMNGLGLIHLHVLKHGRGGYSHFKAYPTLLGEQVRALLKGTE